MAPSMLVFKRQPRHVLQPQVAVAIDFGAFQPRHQVLRWPA
jgi:hypothetical protein